MIRFPEPWGNYLLKNLAETTAPNAINWWPQTIAWQVLFVAMLVYIGFNVYRAIKKYQNNAYRREALAWLKKLPPYRINEPDTIYRQLPSLLRKVALSGYKRDEVCLLSNKSWLQWLDQQCEKTSFTKIPSFTLNQLAYVPAYDIDAKTMDNLVTEITLWIKYHRGLHD
ncbi:DUF4381 domain-containing protein [Moritella sp. Urea-trap-13]|uniref:DUF4381 domain-containing protein n=1 Tax=Moritella sp. Urea-trap-13 TaxID=2058327 RepID=UPI000C33C178|nr:DUF4381 domain-containing protein [Moritella sp. Urea-trap-13]PKH06118.1 hypothetical protein CXF93_09290 [Moritella sp. Urea-trap-13]